MRGIRTTVSFVLALGLLTASSLAATAQEDSTSRAPIPSAGCGSSQVEPGTHRGSTELDGDGYSWVTRVPSAHDGVTPVPLWVQLHGCCGGSGMEQMMLLRRATDEHGFVLVAPEASIGRAGWTWREGDTEVDASLWNPDIAFLDGLLDRLAQDYCLDLARVYAPGYSAGGEGVSVLACVLEDRIAAVAPVAGSLDLGATCEQERPVPVLAIHGTADGLVPFDGGLSERYASIPVVADASVPDRVGAMAARNGCATIPRSEVVSDEVERLSWDCPEAATVELLVIDGGRHVWPKTLNGDPFDAEHVIWEFFEQHAMPE